jgi:hypothetical protein
LKIIQTLGFFVIDGTSKSLSWIDPATGASKGSLGFEYNYL